MLVRGRVTTCVPQVMWAQDSSPRLQLDSLTNWDTQKTSLDWKKNTFGKNKAIFTIEPIRRFLAPRVGAHTGAWEEGLFYPLMGRNLLAVLQALQVFLWRPTSVRDPKGPGRESIAMSS